MYMRYARHLLAAALVLTAVLVASQSAQAQGVQINIGGGGYGYGGYGGGYGGYYPPINKRRLSDLWRVWLQPVSLGLSHQHVLSDEQLSLEHVAVYPSLQLRRRLVSQ